VSSRRKFYLTKRLNGTGLMRYRWNTVYPIYFDAKVSINDGRRVPRSSALWWPQAQHISQACRGLGLQSVLEVSSHNQSLKWADDIV
jgi:signal recognition particle subunit SEC65